MPIINETILANIIANKVRLESSPDAQKEALKDIINTDDIKEIIEQEDLPDLIADLKNKASELTQKGISPAIFKN